MNKIRSFIAIEIPERIKKDVSEIQEKLKRTGSDVGWTRSEGIHLTLKFLGEVGEGKLVEIQKAIEKATEGFLSFRLEVGGIGIFPNPRSPRVLWIGIKDEGNTLKTLQEAIEQETERVGFEKEDRAFTPHLTLGRVRSRKNCDALIRALEEFDKIELGYLNVEEVSLMKSELRPKGAVYTQIWKVSLTGGQG
jgi:2'-5' RNA ligase